MYSPDPWEMSEGDFTRRVPFDKHASTGKQPLNRLGLDLKLLLHNERETRRFLAREVYGVPDELLDDVLRVRLADLE